MRRVGLAALVAGCAEAVAGGRWQNEAMEAARRGAEQAAAHARLTAGALSEAKPTTGQRPPVLPSQWVANASVAQFVDGRPGLAPPGGTTRQLVQDAGRKRRAELNPVRFPVAPAEWVDSPREWFNMTTYITESLIGLHVNGASVLIAEKAGAFEDLFNWLRFASSCGKVEHKGQSLDCWRLSIHSGSLGLSNQLLLDASSSPVFLENNVTQDSVEHSARYEFWEFDAGATLPWVWEAFSEDAFLRPMTCPDGEPYNTTMYIFHPKHQFDIAGQDLADLVGDTVFVCLDVITNQTMSTDHSYAWLTQWEVEVSPSWGQYENCNGYEPPTCWSAERFRVGHEAAYYLGQDAAQRQCQHNPLVGEWYSLPVGGKCKGDARPGDGSCSWRTVQKVKTIDGQCLFKGEAFRESCIGEGRAPFEKTSEAFLRAFASNNRSEGGCPPIDEDAASIIN